MSKKGFEIQLLYSFAFLMSPPAFTNRSLSSTIPCTVLLVDSPLDERGMRMLLLLMRHHRHEWRPVFGKADGVLNVYFVAIVPDAPDIPYRRHMNS